MIGREIQVWCEYGVIVSVAKWKIISIIISKVENVLQDLLLEAYWIF